MARKPTPKQARFADCVLSGMSQADAYRTAYDAKGMKPETIRRKAVDVAKNGTVRALLEQGMSEFREEALWNREKELRRLLGVNDAAYMRIVASEGGDLPPASVRAFSDTAEKLDKLSRITESPTQGQDKPTIIIAGLKGEITDSANLLRMATASEEEKELIRAAIDGGNGGNT